MRHSIYKHKINDKCMKCYYLQLHSFNDCKVFGNTEEGCDDFFFNKNNNEGLSSELARTEIEA